MGALVLSCSCVSDYQDRRYGAGRRVHNQTTKTPPSPPPYRCTVCGQVRGGGER